MAVRWLIAAVVAAGIAVWAAPPDDAAHESPAATQACDAKKKDAVFDLTLKDMDGRDVSLADYKGKVILLNFWATWCGPCVHEMPWFVDFQAKYGSKGFVALGVSTDDSPQDIKAFALEHKINYPLLVGRDSPKVEEAYGPIWAIPVSIFIDRNGNICRRMTGISTREKFEQLIASLL
jgi:peroxiredoxin